MTSTGIAILEDPHPCGHIVYPYAGEKLITQAVGIFAAAGLRREETVVLVSTSSHLEGFEEYLWEHGFDTTALKRTGQLVVFEAWDMLARLSTAGMPDKTRFHSLIGSVLLAAKRKSPSGRVRVFGEMVNLLWKDNLPAALVLEELWNDAIKTHSIALLCTYALDGDSASSRAEFPQSICDTHSHTLIDEKPGTAGSGAF